MSPMKRLLISLVILVASVHLLMAQEVDIRMKGNSYGFMNLRTQQWVTEPVYKDIREIGAYDGVQYYKVQSHAGLWGVLASSDYRKCKIPPKFTEIWTLAYNNFTRVPIIFVSKQGNQGVIEVYTSSCYYLFGGLKYKRADSDIGYDFVINLHTWDGNCYSYGHSDIKKAFEQAKAKDAARQEELKRQKEEQERKERERIAREQKEKELASFTAYAKSRVTPIMNEWQKKGEFEKLAAYELRVTGANRMAKIDEVTRDAERTFIEEHAALNPIEKMTLELYDSENEVFSIMSEKFGQLLLPVPIAEGKEFKDNFLKVAKKEPKYFIENDKLALKSLIFVNPINGKSYVYNNTAALNYSQYQINADDLDIESINITPTKTFTSGSNVKPTCEILFPHNGDTYTEGTLLIKYRTTAGNGLTAIVSVEVNGQEVDLKTVDESNLKGVRLASSLQGEIPVPRNMDSDCVVTLKVKDSDGTFGESKKVTLRYVGAKPKPALHLLSVGVSNYMSKDMTSLSYAAKDAKDFVSTIMGSNHEMYSEVKSNVLLLNNEATSARVKGALNALKNLVSQGDVVMVYLSGHAIKQGEDAYFMTTEASAEEYYNGVEFGFIKKMLRSMSEGKKCRVILFMDSCHSGAMYGMKGTASDFTETIPSVVGFYSSASDQKSAESEKIQNGLFTSALLKGLKGAASNEDGEVTLNGLRDYVQKNVKEAVQEKGQNKQDVIVDIPIGDAVLFRVKK